MLNYFFPYDSDPRHFKSLDGLRGVAVLFVMLSHASLDGLTFASWLDFQGMGKPGVYLFFVLSAYLLDRQIALALRTQKATGLYWKNYFLRRFLRIYPLFAIALLVFFAASWVGSETAIKQPADLLNHLLMVEGKGIFWSIPTEFKYYFLSPLIMMFCHLVLDWKPVATLGTLLGLIAVSIGTQFWFSLSEVSTFRYLPVFLVGTMISIAEVVNEPVSKPARRARLIDWIGVIGFGVILLTTPAFSQRLCGGAINVHHFIYYFPYAVLWGAVLVAARYGLGIVSTVLEFTPLRLIGAISYSIYLFHTVILGIIKLEQIPIANGLRVYLFFIVTIAVAAVSYLCIERPLSRIRLTPAVGIGPGRRRGKSTSFT